MSNRGRLPDYLLAICTQYALTVAIQMFVCEHSHVTILVLVNHHFTSSGAKPLILE